MLDYNVLPNDPIAAKLFGIPVEKLTAEFIAQQIHSGWGSFDPTKVRVTKKDPHLFDPDYHTGNLQHMNAVLESYEPQAQYETLPFIMSDDPFMESLLKQFGYNPRLVEKATIVIETGKPVHIEAKTYPVYSEEPFIGAFWKVDETGLEITHED